jgi:DNA polymerase-3 subunit beta
MRIKILQENLLKAAQDAIKCISSRPPIPVLSNFLLQTKEGGLQITATDLSLGVRIRVGCEVIEEGEAAISGRMLVEFLSGIQSGKIEVRVEDGKMTLKGVSTSGKIPLSSSEDYPPFPEHEGEGVVIPSEKLLGLLEEGGLAAGNDETRPVFSSLLLEFGEKEVVAVSTDGYRLAKKTEPIEASMDVKRVLIPSRAARELQRLIAREKGVVRVLVREEIGQTFFFFGDHHIAVRTNEAEFPNYENIIPQKIEVEIVASAQELSSAVKAVMVFGKEASGIITLHLKQNEIEVRAASAVGSGEATVPAKREKGQDGEISFNGRYLMDFLSLAKENEIRFGMTETLKPGILKIVGKENFFYVVMPFRVQK